MTLSVNTLSLIHTHAHAYAYKHTFTHTDAFLNHHLLVAVTKFDQKYGTASMLGDVATEDEVRSKVCGCIEKATSFKVRFQPPQVIMLSGLWALQSKELLSPTCDRQLKQAAAFQLTTWPGLDGGQEENELLNLLKLGQEVLAKKLERASGITDLEQRYKRPGLWCVFAQMHSHLCKHILCYMDST